MPLGGRTVHVYELAPVSRGYVITGMHHDLLKVAAPLDVGIDLTETGKL